MMGYDYLVTAEDGEIEIVITDWDTSMEIKRIFMQLRKGQKISVEILGVNR